MYGIALHYLKSYRAGADSFCVIFRSEDYTEERSQLATLGYAMLCYEVHSTDLNHNTYT